MEHHGEVIVSELRIAREEARRLVSERGLPGSPIDMRDVVSTLSIMDHFGFTETHSAAGIPRQKFALTVRPDQQEDTRFIQNVALNRGLRMKTSETKEDTSAVPIGLGITQQRAAADAS